MAVTVATAVRYFCFYYKLFEKFKETKELDYLISIITFNFKSKIKY